MQINASQINFSAIVRPQAPAGATPQAPSGAMALNAEVATAQNANSFARMLQNRQQGAALQAVAMERHAAPPQAQAQAPSQVPAQTRTQAASPTAGSAQKTPRPEARHEKTADRAGSSRLPQRSDGPRTAKANPQAPETPEKATSDEVRTDPADGPVVGLSEWWVPMGSTPVPTAPGPVDINGSVDETLPDPTSSPISCIDGKPKHTPGVKRDPALDAGSDKTPVGTPLSSADTPICPAPEVGAGGADIGGGIRAAADATASTPADTLPAPATLIAGSLTAPAAPRASGLATARADRDDAIGRADGARNALTPIPGNSLESLARIGGEAARTAAAAPVSEGRSFAETLAAAPAGVPTARGEAGPTAAPVAVSIATPATAPEFREALGVQVSLLVKDGVQSAELHLNPSDMGPISVQITTDGMQAQVDFGADSATTRQIIEQGLPELAGALRDAGITLTGGGVSQHARGQSDDARSDADGRRSTRRMTVGGSDAAAAVRSVQTSRGQVDLYA